MIFNVAVWLWLLKRPEAVGGPPPDWRDGVLMAAFVIELAVFVAMVVK